MVRLHVIDFVTYRWRYSLGYITVGLALIVLLIVAGFIVPGGLTQPEMASAVASSDLSVKHFIPEMVLNAPYHVLQKISFYLFGVSDISIKLPSLLIGFASAVGIILLLRSWFKPNVAVLTTLLVVTTGQFLVVTQTGTPQVLYHLWTIWLLLAATMLSRCNTSWLFVWKLALFSFIALSLYTPLSAYIIFALMSAGLLHPHLRHTIKKFSKLKLFFASMIGFVLVSPIIYAIFQEPSVGLKLLGIPSQLPAIGTNLQLLFSEYFDFAHPTNGIMMTPIYSLASVILILLGLYRMFTSKYTARSYIITGWLLLLIPVLVINPQVVAITFVPFLLLMALGINHLIGYWYKLFPANPYARIAGLIPLVILIASMTFSGIERFVYGYSYSDDVAQNFSKDVPLLRHELSLQNGTSVLWVSPAEASFYHTFKKYYKKNNFLTVTTDNKTPYSTLIVSHDAQPKKSFEVPTKIVTGAYSNQADRFYVYKKTEF